MKPIFLSDEIKEELRKEFEKQLEKDALYDGAFSFKRNWKFKKEDSHVAFIYYTPEAYSKIIQLVKHFNSEVAWHAFIVRDEEDPFTYIVNDIIVYGQKVTGSTVDTDDEEYTKFMIGLSDEEAKEMRGQMHSHVNMAVSPSSVDKTHQSDILKTLKDGFYVFQIWNKKHEIYSVIYDLDNNVMFENKDIELDILDERDGSINGFIIEADNLVKEYKVKTETKTKSIYEPTKRESKNSDSGYWDEDDNYWYNGYKYPRYNY